MKTYLQNLRWGTFNLIEGDMISSIASYYGEWSEVEVTVFQQLLKPTSNVIEVGSNIGMHAVPLAKIAHQGKVICFEPQRIIFQQLCCNLALNDITNVESYRLGVSEEADTFEIEGSDYNTAWNYGSFSLDKGFSTEHAFDGKVQKERIDVISLDEFPAVADLNSLALLKIDAEGFDIKVLKGAEKTIKRLQPAIFIEVQPQSATEIFNHLRHLDYRVFSVASLRYQEKNFNQVPQAENDCDFNFLALPKTTVNVTLGKTISALMEIKSVEDCNKEMPLLVLL
ncbi:hypothetical protein X875_1250 [Mannheimia varigena USDA-ARS-USMARC-1388]|uniref:Methyltransferase FkbM domain-containing protein n=1 Tax=Mannheimia varigena USDA-ARS-USMARC-1296 TaxID=1433287 RepID=W0QF68_9PAST|nr:FkbM family methyltransferase [Mannheimia varigena]AHG76520.1 hypothetical protein X808_20020 [Mannheimia varigena USDA-ARS-USMARC-1296]AHG78747.1 hypothetical protein X875_1250 [Mannheimia varigena USDA-ARS-USMARC-1388]MDY2946914.1 FkbM family methyltransferase [Mannheimia varigena]QLD34160.1 FkbM family methyltransferase [Mannheimia varigena]